MNTMTQTTTGNNLADANGEQMRKAFLKKIKSMLETQKNEIEKRIESNIRGGEIDDNGDDTDLVQARILALAAKQLADRDKNKLLRIGGAIKRIEENRYGECGKCEEPIDERRLLIDPSFFLCSGCAELIELKAKKGC
jgi:DnaK suppressor protein